MTSHFSAMSRTIASRSSLPLSARNCSSSGARSKWSTIASLPRPVTRITCSTPDAMASSTTYWMVGMSTIGSISFGIAFVAGRNRVPSPAAGMTALRMLTPARSVDAAELPLLGFLQGLAVDAEGSDGAGAEPLETDGLAALLALAVAAVFDARDRLFDLADQLPLAVADAQREVAVRLERRAIRRIGEVL